MTINAKTATAAAALLIGAGAFPFAATAQSESEQVEVEVQEVNPDGGQAAGATEEQADALVESDEEQAVQVEQSTEPVQVEQAAEGTQPVEVDTTSADLEETQKQELEQAAAEGREVPRPEMILGAQKDGEWMVSNLMDREVTTPNDEDIGDISDVILAEDGPQGVIVDVGGFLGLGEKQVAIKWNELQFSQDAIMVDASKEALENAPEFMTLEEKEAQAQAAAEQEQLEAQQPETMAQEGEAMPPATEQTAQESDTLEPTMTEEPMQTDETMQGETMQTEETMQGEENVEIEVETQN